MFSWDFEFSKNFNQVEIIKIISNQHGHEVIYCLEKLGPQPLTKLILIELMSNGPSNGSSNWGWARYFIATSKSNALIEYPGNNLKTVNFRELRGSSVDEFKKMG